MTSLCIMCKKHVNYDIDVKVSNGDITPVSWRHRDCAAEHRIQRKTMTQRKDGKPKKMSRKRLPKNRMELSEYWERAYVEGYREALKELKFIVDEKLRELK